jgi:hypothetical protein
MKINFKNQEFKMNWKELAAFILVIYLLVTDNLAVVVEFIKSLLK